MRKSPFLCTRLSDTWQGTRQQLRHSHTGWTRGPGWMLHWGVICSIAFFPLPLALSCRRAFSVTKPGSSELTKPLPRGFPEQADVSVWLWVLSLSSTSKGCPEPPTFPSSPPGGCGHGTKHGCAGRCCSASAPLPAPCEASLVMSQGCISPWRTVQGRRRCQLAQQCRAWGRKG